MVGHRQKMDGKWTEIFTGSKNGCSPPLKRSAIWAFTTRPDEVFYRGLNLKQHPARSKVIVARLNEVNDPVMKIGTRSGQQPFGSKMVAILARLESLIRLRQNTTRKCPCRKLRPRRGRTTGSMWMVIQDTKGHRGLVKMSD